MVHPSYQKGYYFERRVRKHLEEKGYFVIRSGKSRFPDGIAIKRGAADPEARLIILFECKVNKYLSKEEHEKAAEIMDKTGVPLTVYYRDGRKLRSYMLHRPWMVTGE